MSDDKLGKMDEKLDTLITGFTAFSTEIKAEFKAVKEKVEDHDTILYGVGTDKPGLIAKFSEVYESISKVKKITLAAVTALVGGLVTMLVKLIHLGD